MLCYAMIMTNAEFVNALNQKFGNKFTSSAPGARYTRIIRSGSAYCFIDAEGNIYKAASWKSPVKGVRSTLATVDINKCDPYGSWLYRTKTVIQ